MIADLNPAIPATPDTEAFDTMLASVVTRATARSLSSLRDRGGASLPSRLDGLLEDSKDFGNRYFYIPGLDRTRGASHLFIAKLEEMPVNRSAVNKEDGDVSLDEGLALAEDLAMAAISLYVKLLSGSSSAVCWCCVRVC